MRLPQPPGRPGPLIDDEVTPATTPGRRPDWPEEDGQPPRNRTNTRRAPGPPFERTPGAWSFPGTVFPAPPREDAARYRPNPRRPGFAPTVRDEVS